MSLRPSFYGMIGVACLAFGCCLLPSMVHPSAASSTAASASADAAPRLVIEAGGHQAVIRKLLFTADGRELATTIAQLVLRLTNGAGVSVDSTPLFFPVSINNVGRLFVINPVTDATVDTGINTSP